MWPFANGRERAIVVFHIDADGRARGAFFRGSADVLIVDERDPRERVFYMNQETPRADLRRRIGKHPLGRQFSAREAKPSEPRPMLSVHWCGADGELQV